MARRKKRKKKKKESILDQIERIVTKTGKITGSHKLAKAGVVAAIFGVLIKATALTQTFPQPFDLLGNLILFIAILIIVFDIAKGGLLD